ncbi:MAG: flavin reductase [Phycisphaerales bacterium]|nr:flavin reductase [Phycisphaerales bacterium]
MSMSDAHTALAQLPSSPYLMTSCFEGERAGLIVRSVQSCDTEPALLCVAVRTGHRIEPLIRDSRCFALSRVDNESRLVLRKFDRKGAQEPGDPFDAIAMETMQTGCPVLCASPLVFDCEVVRHFDLEADCELYIGQVLASRALRG